ncbi:hypothetical protein PFFCH_00891 [Plasmodium falciparum FCH/4]|uniref:Uncharacterized protein n=1 Tax=Plasmodium falciparum FCH/4 TaxID=1036724 RepID=A0A024VT28_PLAFA|nr:hypothetical protein PFFCH_00891 [Plasmodium falciparum FCH/4]
MINHNVNNNNNMAGNNFVVGLLRNEKN